jgi:predicted transcriptional regulator
MSDDVTIPNVLAALEQWEAKRRGHMRTPSATVVELGRELGAAEDDVRPLVEQAVSDALVEEDAENKGYYYLTDDGKSFLDASLFT